MDKEQKDIPRVFWDNEKDQHFKNCKVCGRDLLDEQCTYGIQKVVKRYPDQKTEQILFEYAICFPCMEEAKAKFSRESRERMDNYLREEMSRLLSHSPDQRPSFWTGQCSLSGKALHDMQEYQMIAACQGNKLLDEPMLISDGIMEEMNELLSPETKDELKRFRDNNFGWPPELAKLLETGDLVLL